MEYNPNKQKKIIKKMKLLLDTYKTDSSNKFTHISMGGHLFPGKYNIEDTKIKRRLIKIKS